MLNRVINILIFFVLVIIYAADMVPAAYDPYYLNIILFLDLAAFLSFSINNEKYDALKAQKLKFSTLFLLGFIIVHFQGYVDLFFGFLEEDFELFWVNKNKIVRALLYSSLALNAFFVGYSFYLTKRDTVYDNTGKRSYKMKPLQLINLLLILIFISQIDSSFLSSSDYGDRTLSPMLGYSMLLFETSTVALILHNIRNNAISGGIKGPVSYIRSFGFSFYVFCFYLFCILLSGDRGPIIYLSLAFIFGFVYTTKFKLSTISFYVGGLAIAFFISLLGILRKFSSDQSVVDTALSADYYNRYYPDSILPFTKELAGSIRTVHIAVNSVPEKYDHFYGLFTFQNFSLIIPGFNSFVNKLYGINAEYLTSAKFITFLELGSDATWGLGTSAVADVYIDFGVWGVILLFLFFGYFSRKVEVDVLVFSKINIGTLAIYLLFFSFSIYISRSNLVVPFTKFPYVIGFYYLLVLINRKK